MEERIVEVAALFIREEVQVRSIRYDAVKDYAEAMKAGIILPPPDVFPSGSRYYPADGVHRVLGAQKAGLETMIVRVHEGGHREAVLFAVSANATNGIRRTNADKRKAVTILLMDEEWKTWTDHRIAEHCGVSQPMVSSLKKELTENDFQFPSRRKCKNGKTMETNKIGKPSVEPAEPDRMVSEQDAMPQEPEEIEVERLRARVVELEEEIAEKDRRIAELEEALAQAKPFWPPVVTQEGTAEARLAGN